MKDYIFTIQTRGVGNTPKQAWADACDNILHQLDEFLDPEDIPDYEIEGINESYVDEDEDESFDEEGE
jgi:hypothetical protein